MKAHAHTSGVLKLLRKLGPLSKKYRMPRQQQPDGIRRDYYKAILPYTGKAKSAFHVVRDEVVRLLVDLRKEQGRTDAEWNEEDHPRDKDGKFGEGGGDSGGAYEGHSAATAKDLDKAEGSITTRKTEKGYGYDAKGERVGQYMSGSNEEVGVPIAALARMENGTFTHNHPPHAYIVAGTRYHVSYSFSPTDIQMASKYNLKEVRAVGSTVVNGKQERVAHIMTRPANGWPTPEKLTETIAKYGNGSVARTNEAMKAEPDALKRVELSAAGLHDVWHKTAAELGMRYRRVVIK